MKSVRFEMDRPLNGQRIPADSQRTPNGLQRIPNGFPADSQRIPNGFPADSQRIPGGFQGWPTRGGGSSRVVNRDYRMGVVTRCARDNSQDPARRCASRRW